MNRTIIKIMFLLVTVFFLLVDNANAFNGCWKMSGTLAVTGKINGNKFSSVNISYDESLLCFNSNGTFKSDNSDMSGTWTKKGKDIKIDFNTAYFKSAIESDEGFNDASVEIGKVYFKGQIKKNKIAGTMYLKKGSISNKNDNIENNGNFRAKGRFTAYPVKGFYYSFDELLGNIAIDSSGNKNHGNITASSRVEGKIGNGLLFGADNARVSINNSLYFDNGLITIEAWIKPNEVETGKVYRIIGEYDYHGLCFQIRDGRLEILYDGQSYHYGTVSIQPDVWTHIAFTSDGANIVTFINGVEDNRSNITLPVRIVENINIGANWIYTGGSQLFDYIEEFPGIIDELKIWDISLSSDEIIKNFDKQPVNPITVFIKALYWSARYSFDESSGTIAIDSSGNKNHGNITAASRVEGKIGNGLLFGADNARISISNSLYFDKGLITIEAWIKPYKVESGKIYRLIGGYNYHDFYFQIRDGRLEILYDGQSYHYGTVSIQPDVWTHIAFTSDGTDVITYINGVEDGRSNITLPITSFVNINIGANYIYTGGGQLFDYIEEFPGIIDELKIWGAVTSPKIYY